MTGPARDAIKVTATDRALLALIADRTRTTGWPPTVREIAQALDVGTSAVHRRLDRLVAGRVHRAAPPRALRLTARARDVIERRD